VAQGRGWLLAAAVLVAGCGSGPAPPAEPLPAVPTAGAPLRGDLRAVTYGRIAPDLRPRPEAGIGTDGTLCLGVDLQPDAANVAAVERATLCLLNDERLARHLPALRPNAELARAALGHARDLVRHRYFSHRSRSGATVVDRIRRTGYLRGAGFDWTVGENVAWGLLGRAQPRAIVAAWMRSPEHRAALLRKQFEEIGLGVALGAPKFTHLPGATYNTDFGAVRAPAP